MKIKLLNISLLLFLTVGFIQDSKESLLCEKKWELKFIQVGGSKMPIPEGEKFKMWMVFTKDGVHKVNTTDGIKNGKWKFTKNKDSLIISNFKGEDKGLKLNSLNEKELAFTTTEMGGTGTLYFELYKEEK